MLISLAAVLGFATLIITAKAMDNVAAFGTLLFIHAYMLFFSELTSFKTWQAIIRFGSDEVENKNPKRLAQLFKTGLITDAAAALAAFLIAIISFEFYNWLNGLIHCSVILFRQINVSIGVFRLFDKFSVLALRALVMPSVRFIGALIVWHQGWGFIGFLAVWYLASLLGYLVLIGFGLFEIVKRGLWPLIKSEAICKPSTFPEFYPFLLKANIDSTIKSLKKNFPNLAVMLFLGPIAIAIYRIADEISRILARGISLFDQVLLLIFGEQIISLAFEEGLAGASTLSVMLLVASSLIGIALPFYTIFYVLTRPGTAIWVRLIGAIAFIAIFFALSKPFGLYAIGWAAKQLHLMIV